MKACAYCGLENPDEAAQCQECGTAEFKDQPSNLPPVLPSTSQGILLTNIDHLPGRKIVEHYGLVAGNTVRAKHVGRDIMASLKNIVGGELRGYTELLQDARAEATQRMVAQAADLGADAVINVRFCTSSVAQGASELYAYGTAVRTESRS